MVSICGPAKRHDPLPKKLRYLVMVGTLEKSECMPSELKYTGFIGNRNPLCTQFFTGEEDHPVFGRIVQLPKVFFSKDSAETEIEALKKTDLAFKENNHYMLVPIDVGEDEPKRNVD